MAPNAFRSIQPSPLKLTAMPPRFAALFRRTSNRTRKPSMLRRVTQVISSVPCWRVRRVDPSPSPPPIPSISPSTRQFFHCSSCSGGCSPGSRGAASMYTAQCLHSTTGNDAIALEYCLFGGQRVLAGRQGLFVLVAYTRRKVRLLPCCRCLMGHSVRAIGYLVVSSHQKHRMGPVRLLYFSTSVL